MRKLLHAVLWLPILVLNSLLFLGIFAHELLHLITALALQLKVKRFVVGTEHGLSRKAWRSGRLTIVFPWQRVYKTRGHIETVDPTKHRGRKRMSVMFRFAICAVMPTIITAWFAFQLWAMMSAEGNDTLKIVYFVLYVFSSAFVFAASDDLIAFAFTIRDAWRGFKRWVLRLS